MITQPDPAPEAVGDYVYHRNEGPGYEGEVVEVKGDRMKVAWPIPGRRRKVVATYHRDELACTDPARLARG